MDLCTTKIHIIRFEIKLYLLFYTNSPQIFLRYMSCRWFGLIIQISFNERSNQTYTIATQTTLLVEIFFLEIPSILNNSAFEANIYVSFRERTEKLHSSRNSFHNPGILYDLSPTNLAISPPLQNTYFHNINIFLSPPNIIIINSKRKRGC